MGGDSKNNSLSQQTFNTKLEIVMMSLRAANPYREQRKFKSITDELHVNYEFK
jgi:hypothetical protein